MTADIVQFPPSIQEDFEDRLGTAYDNAQVLTMALHAAASRDCVVTDSQLLALLTASCSLEDQLRQLLAEVARKNGAGDDHGA